MTIEVKTSNKLSISQLPGTTLSDTFTPTTGDNRAVIMAICVESSTVTDTAVTLDGVDAVLLYEDQHTTGNLRCSYYMLTDKEMVLEPSTGITFSYTASASANIIAHVFQVNNIENYIDDSSFSEADSSGEINVSVTAQNDYNIFLSCGLSSISGQALLTYNSGQTEISAVEGGVFTSTIAYELVSKGSENHSVTWDDDTGDFILLGVSISEWTNRAPRRGA